MEFICIILASIVIIATLLIVFKLNPKKSKEIAENKELNKLSEKYPSNLNICKDILKMLKNEKVKIEEDENAKDCLYMVAFDKVIIAGTQTNFTRIQTIAHECIHSIQDKRIQMFNFVFTNIILLYFIIVLILGILRVIPDEYQMLILSIFILMGFLSFVIRSYLENDAMIKAKYLAKEYMEKQNVCSEEEINKLVDGFEQINDMGIKGTSFSLMLNILVKVIILAIVFIVV